MVLFQKRVKIYSQQKWYHVSQKRIKIPQHKWTISEKGQKSSTKMVPFQKRVKNPRQKWYHFQKGSKFLNKNGTISEEGQNSSTKMVPFQKRVKIHQQKWYHFRRGSNIVNKNGTIFVRKGSKLLNKNGTISEKGQKLSFHFPRNKISLHFLPKFLCI